MVEVVQYPPPAWIGPLVVIPPVPLTVREFASTILPLESRVEEELGVCAV
jgi:hypothetical protein